MIPISSLSKQVTLMCGAIWLGVSSAGMTQESVNVSASDTGAAKAGEPSAKPAPNPELQKLLGEAQDLQSRHRYFDALAKLDEAEKLAPNDPNVFNIRGAIYLVPAVRQFDKAKEQFEKASALEPTALAPKFNLSELLFVKHSFAEAEAAFAALLKEYTKLQMPVRHLVAFKLLVSQAEQNKIDEANKTMNEHFTFMDDTPAYYFAKATLAFVQKKDDEAKEWLEKANVIFKSADNAPYLDSLMETRRIPNIMFAPSAPK
jgi:tetratricopeptide (TPR) repeat protein